jgi:hypothetical protein
VHVDLLGLERPNGGEDPLTGFVDRDHGPGHIY